MIEATPDFERDLFANLSTTEWARTTLLQTKVPGANGAHHRVLSKFERRGVVESRLVQGHYTREREWRLKVSP